jgi:hypothetical protein
MVSNIQLVNTWFQTYNWLIHGFRDVVRDIKEELHYADMFRMAGRRRGPRGRRGRDHHEPYSDEDSDEETVRLNARFPQGGGEAKFQITDVQKLLRLLILGGVTMARGRQLDPVQNSDFHVITRMISEGSGETVCVLSSCHLMNIAVQVAKIVFVSSYNRT